MNAELIERLVRTVLQVAGALFPGASWYSEARWGVLTGAAVTLITTAWTVWAGWNAPRNA